MARSVLEKARRLGARGRHSAIITLLEPQLPLFRNSLDYYYLLGSACLRTGDIGGASTYLRRAEQLDPRDLDTKLCLAALHLRRGESDKAISLYLLVLDDRTRDPTARRALSFLKGADAQEKIAALVDTRGFERFLPPLRGLPFWAVPLSVFIIAVVCLVLAFPFIDRGISLMASRAEPRPEVASVDLSESERKNPVGATGSARYILTEKEAVAAFERAKARFQEYRDNAAIVEINRIIDSNASRPLKEKARTLLAFVSAPDWRSLRDIPDLAEVLRDPALYRDTSVIWKGRAANIHGKDTDREFDFLVGYADRTRLDGILKVRVTDGSLFIPADGPFELLARVIVEGSSPSLRALAIHVLLASP
jgi:tetratricopeptide (TPR) repeat protein